MRNPPKIGFCRTGKRVIDHPDVVLLEGIFALYWTAVREKLAMKIFVDVDSDMRLARRGNSCVLLVASSSSLFLVAKSIPMFLFGGSSYPGHREATKP